MADILISNNAEPVTPETGKTKIYIDSTTKKLSTKDDAGTVVEYGESAGSLDLQNAYDSSTNPEIVVADTTDAALTVRDSASNVNRDNILEVQNTGGNTISAFTRLGQTINGVFSLVNQVAGSVAMTIKGVALQTADYFKVVDSADNTFFRINDEGNIVLRESADDNDIVVTTEANENNAGFGMRGTAGTFQFHMRSGNTLNFTINQNSLTHNGALRSGRGSIAAPAHTCSADAGSGMAFPVNDEVTISAAATQCMNFTTTETETKLPFKLAQYTTAGLPAAASFEGCIVYDTDTNQVKFSNGSTWNAM